MRSALTSFLLMLAMAAAGCTQFPELEAAQSEGVAEAPYPALVPLDGLLTAPRQPVATADVIPQVEARVGGLRSRAERLQRVSVAQPVSVARRLALLRQRAEDLRATP